MANERAGLLQRYRTVADRVVGVLRAHPKVVGVALCGSLVSGEVWERSDVDMVAVLRDPDADWQALSVHCGDVRIHLQLLSEMFLLGRGEGFRGGVLSRVLAGARIAYDAEGVLASGIRDMTAYPRDQQVRHAVRHLIGFLAERSAVCKCLLHGHSEDAFLHANAAFRALAHVEYARSGRLPGRNLVEGLVEVSPSTYTAYVWFVHGCRPVPDRLRRALAFFERILDAIFQEVGPLLATALRSCSLPLTEEDLGEVTLIDDRSADVQELVDQLVERRWVREQRRRLFLDGVPVEGLSEALFGLF